MAFASPPTISTAGAASTAAPGWNASPPFSPRSTPTSSPSRKWSAPRRSSQARRRSWAPRYFGNVVLSRFPVRHHVQHDLTWQTCEPRNVQRVDVEIGSHLLHLYNVHLGTALLERRHQAARLANHLVHDKRVTGPKIVLGDFNEWARGLATDILAERLQSVDLRQHLRRKRTYPGFFPILHLDHIYYEGRVDVVKVTLPRDRLTLIASDHLPLVADLRIGFDAVPPAIPAGRRG
jgi:endonuclease/exonuclease/phosphatase family metal-dependent hydrolase